jgi:hypothetical protein
MSTCAFLVLWIIVECIIQKTIQLKTWTGPEDSREMRLPDFKVIGT